MKWITWAQCFNIRFFQSSSRTRYHPHLQPLPTSNGKADFTPTITNETVEGTITMIVGGVQTPKKTKAAFVPTVTDETVPRECIGIIGVSRKPTKTSQ